MIPYVELGAAGSWELDAPCSYSRRCSCCRLIRGGPARSDALEDSVVTREGGRTGLPLADVAAVG